MRLLPKGWNPLAFVFWAIIISLPFWLIPPYEKHAVVAIAFVLADVTFLALYLGQSRFAWHVAIALNIGLAIYHFIGGRHLRVDIVLSTILIAYLSIVRHDYFQYISTDAT